MLMTEVVRNAKQEILSKLFEDLVKNYTGKDELPTDVIVEVIKDDLGKMLGHRGLDIRNLQIELCPDESNMTVCILGE